MNNENKLVILVWFALALAAEGANAAEPSGPSTANVIAAPVKHDIHRMHDVMEVEEYIQQAESELSKKTKTKKEIETLHIHLLSAYDALAARRSLIGNTAGAIDAMNIRDRLQQRYFPGDVGVVRSSEIHDIDSSHAVSAIDEIVKAAKNRQIVILNEAHHVAYDRIFAMRLAKELRKIGFNYLACETFSIDDDHVLSKGYVTNISGYYSSEPRFANFLTDAIADKWTFVSYETGGGEKFRESDMAKNLVERIFQKDPKARVFIYGGYNHASKAVVSTSDSDESRMASQLKRLTGIDPLTIDQTMLYDHQSSDSQLTDYKHALAKQKTSEAYVLKTPTGDNVHFGLSGRAYDFYVVHPKYAIDPENGRYSWLNLKMSGNYIALDIPKELLPGSGKRTIYAYHEQAPKDAVPADVVVVTAGEPAPKFILPIGEYSFEFED